MTASKLFRFDAEADATASTKKSGYLLAVIFTSTRYVVTSLTFHARPCGMTLLLIGADGINSPAVIFWAL